MDKGVTTEAEGKMGTEFVLWDPGAPPAQREVNGKNMQMLTWHQVYYTIYDWCSSCLEGGMWVIIDSFKNRCLLLNK